MVIESVSVKFNTVTKSKSARDSPMGLRAFAQLFVRLVSTVSRLLGVKVGG